MEITNELKLKPIDPEMYKRNHAYSIPSMSVNLSAGVLNINMKAVALFDFKNGDIALLSNSDKRWFMALGEKKDKGFHVKNKTKSINYLNIGRALSRMIIKDLDIKPKGKIYFGERVLSNGSFWYELTSKKPE